MASYEVLAANQSALIEETSFSASPKSKRSFLPSHGIKKLLKSVRKFFKKPKASPIQYNGDLSIMEILSNEQQSVDVSFFSEEECDNLENERLEAELEAQMERLQ